MNKANEKPTIFFYASAEQRDRRRKALAAQNPLNAFKVEHTTFDFWIADLWDILGDEKQIISPVQRLAFAIRALEVLAEEEPLSRDFGTARELASCIKAATGVQSFDDAVKKAAAGDSIDGLAQSQIAALKCIGLYHQLIDCAGLIEPGYAVVRLASSIHEAYPQGAHCIFWKTAPITIAQQQILAQFDGFDHEYVMPAGFQGPQQLSPEVNLSFAFSSGRYAHARTLLEEISLAIPQGSVLVSCKDPVATYEDLATILEKKGVQSICLATVSALNTDFGRAFSIVANLHKNKARSENASSEDVGIENANKDLFSDFAHNPYSLMKRSEARELDTALMGDRLADPLELISEHESAYSSYNALLSLTCGANIEESFAILRDTATRASGKSRSWLAKELSAITALKDCVNASVQAGISFDHINELLETLHPVYEVATKVQKSTVVLASRRSASTFPADSFATVIIADADEENLPVAEGSRPSSELLRTLGIPEVDTSLMRVRRQFWATLESAKHQVIIEMRLFDCDTEPLSSSSVVQEFIDVYRLDSTNNDEIKNRYALPASLLTSVREYGEELVLQNADIEESTCLQSQDCSDQFALDKQLGNAIASSWTCDDGATKLRLSPSQVELYLECPRKWLLNRRVKGDGLFEGFSALEKGSFAHAALERFHRILKDNAGVGRVARNNLERARQILKKAVDEVIAETPSKKPGDRLVPLGAIEEKERDEIVRNLEKFLDFEADLLPGFVPWDFEYEIKPEQEIEYAGCVMSGKIDRIDVDENGRAVIIDYKGSAGDKYALDDDGKPKKVQALIYAQMLERIENLQVVGTLYVSYGSRQEASGAFDESYISAESIPGLAKGCAVARDGGFQSLLDETEEIVSIAVDRMKQGIVSPEPALSTACAYCCDTTCPERLG